MKDLLCLVGSNSWIYKEGKDRNLYVLETVCKDLDFSFNPKRLTTKGEIIAYIRGFFDAEGGIPHNKRICFNHRIVAFDKSRNFF